MSKSALMRIFIVCLLIASSQFYGCATASQKTTGEDDGLSYSQSMNEENASQDHGGNVHSDASDSNTEEKKEQNNNTALNVIGYIVGFVIGFAIVGL